MFKDKTLYANIIDSYYDEQEQSTNVEEYTMNNVAIFPNKYKKLVALLNKVDENP